MTAVRRPMLDLTPDEVLTTTRTVRKRLDFGRPVEREVIEECLRIAQQAPSASNRQDWHFVVVTDAEKRAGLAELYRRGFYGYRNAPRPTSRTRLDRRRRTACGLRRTTSRITSTRCRSTSSPASRGGRTAYR